MLFNQILFCFDKLKICCFVKHIFVSVQTKYFIDHNNIIQCNVKFLFGYWPIIFFIYYATITASAYLFRTGGLHSNKSSGLLSTATASPHCWCRQHSHVTAYHAAITAPAYFFHTGRLHSNKEAVCFLLLLPNLVCLHTSPPRWCRQHPHVTAITQLSLSCTYSRAAPSVPIHPWSP